MIDNKQLIALYTIVRRELVRMWRISTQVFLPPVITTALYFLIFGALIGKRIGQIGDVSYGTFIAPGLIMMSVITNAYGNVSSSLFSVRFQKSIEEMLISPMASSILLLGYVLGGVLRGLLIAILVLIVSWIFVPINIHHWLLFFSVIILVAAIFSLAGFTNAMLARTFDDVTIVPTFILTPLTYLGGIFYTTSMLPPFWKIISHFNPMFYMITIMRYTMINNSEASVLVSLIVIFSMLSLLIGLNLTMLKKGIGLRD